MADTAPRSALAEQSRSDLAALVADAWSDRGWAVAGGASDGADVLATREGAYTEYLAILVAEPGSAIDAETVQRAAGVREHERADVVLVVGTDDLTDGATELARREALNVKVLDGWALCRVLDEQNLLSQIDAGTAPANDGATAAGGGQGAVGSQRQADDATATPVGDGDATGAAPDDSAASESTAGGGDDGDATTPSAADNERPCPACGEPIFRPLIEQGLQCPYCDADFE